MSKNQKRKEKKIENAQKNETISQNFLIIQTQMKIKKRRKREKIPERNMRNSNAQHVECVIFYFYFFFRSAWLLFLCAFSKIIAHFHLDRRGRAFFRFYTYFYVRIVCNKNRLQNTIHFFVFATQKKK